jgi:hypothetical protein
MRHLAQKIVSRVLLDVSDVANIELQSMATTTQASLLTFHNSIMHDDELADAGVFERQNEIMATHLALAERLNVSMRYEESEYLPNGSTYVYRIADGLILRPLADELSLAAQHLASLEADDPEFMEFSRCVDQKYAQIEAKFRDRGNGGLEV